MASTAARVDDTLQRMNSAMSALSGSIQRMDDVLAICRLSCPRCGGRVGDEHDDDDVDTCNKSRLEQELYHIHDHLHRMQADVDILKTSYIEICRDISLSTDRAHAMSKTGNILGDIGEWSNVDIVRANLYGLPCLPDNR